MHYTNATTELEESKENDVGVHCNVFIESRAMEDMMLLI